MSRSEFKGAFDIVEDCNSYYPGLQLGDIFPTNPNADGCHVNIQALLGSMQVSFQLGS